MWFEFLWPFFLKSLRLLGSGLRPEPRRWLELHKFLLKQEGWNFVQNSLSLKYTVMYNDYQTLIIQNLFYLAIYVLYHVHEKKGTYFNLLIVRNL